MDEECGTARLRGIDAGRFTYEIPERRPYPYFLTVVRRWLFKAFVVGVFLLTVVCLSVMFRESHFCQGDNGEALKTCIHNVKLCSVPIVCLLFTWFHVWLALQMMFYPIEFHGCPRKPIVPAWLGLPINGWQGIVPRKANIMAERVCDRMIGNIVTIEEFMDRVDADHFWHSLQDSFGKISNDVVERLVKLRFSSLWEKLPATVQDKIKRKVGEETKGSFLAALNELKLNINTILDLRQMSSDAIGNNPELLVWMFKQVAQRELSFITHVAAVMGFLLGLVQVILYVFLQNVSGFDYVMLPLSGLIIGYFTNWLAIKMTFYPIWPHMYLTNMLNLQGVFMKRQREVAGQLSRLICEKVIDSRAMLAYMIESPRNTERVGKLLEIYRKHIGATMDNSVGRMGFVAPSFLKEYVKEDLMNISLEILSEHTDEITKYMDDTMKVEETLTYRLERITPPEFERILHPIFEEDEWILLLVGAVLGVVIGVLQAWALQSL